MHTSKAYTNEDSHAGGMFNNLDIWTALFQINTVDGAASKGSTDTNANLDVWKLQFDKKDCQNGTVRCECAPHSLSQQGVWVPFGHPNPQKSPLTAPKIVCEKFLNMSISSIQLDFFNSI